MVFSDDLKSHSLFMDSNRLTMLTDLNKSDLYPERCFVSFSICIIKFCATCSRHLFDLFLYRESKASDGSRR